MELSYRDVPRNVFALMLALDASGKVWVSYRGVRRALRMQSERAARTLVWRGLQLGMFEWGEYPGLRVRRVVRLSEAGRTLLVRTLGKERHLAIAS